jgi:hypothetical protein
MLISRHQNAGQNHNIKIAKRSFENIAQLKYFRRRVTNQNLIYGEIMCRLNSGKLRSENFSSNLLSKNAKI